MGRAPWASPSCCSPHVHRLPGCSRPKPSIEAKAEITEVMGDYWVSADDIGALEVSSLRDETDGEF